MGKKRTKNEKLDLILSELSEIKREIKKFLKHQATASDQGVKVISRSAAATPAVDMEPSTPGLIEPPKSPASSQ